MVHNWETVPGISAKPSPDHAAVAQELERIAASDSFRKAERCMRLLRYLTDRTIDGQESRLKEYTLGVAVFDRSEAFDPRTDPVVRLEARRLRLKLAEYYQAEGLADPVIIELPKGAYVPHFRARAESTPEPPAVPRSNRWLLPSVAAMTVILAATAAWFIVHRRAERPALRPAIAVIGFRDLSGKPENSWIGTALSEFTNIELGTDQQLRTAPAENVARMRTEMGVTAEASYPAQVLERIGADLGVDYAIAGAYQTNGDQVRLDAALFEIASGRQIAAIQQESPKDRVAALAQACASAIRSRLGIRFSPAQGTPVYQPQERAAMEAYARGMERLRQSDALGAQPLLESAASIAPEKPLVHSGLAAAWSMLGFDGRARQEAKRAFDLSGSLGRVEQLEIEGRYRQMDHDWLRAVQVYQALFTLLPDDLEYGLMLAAVQANGGKAHDALATVNALRALPSPLRDDPRIDLAEARSAGALADFTRTRQMAHVAAEKARKRGARLQYARARLLEAGAMQNLNLPGYSEARAEARSICLELGDLACAAAAYRIEANVLAAAGSPDAALPLYEAVLEIANRIGNLNEKLNALNGLGYCETLRGDLRAAETDYRGTLEVAEEIGGQKPQEALVDLGEVLAAQGRIAEARALGEKALESARQRRDPQSIGASQALQGSTLALEGKLDESIAQYREAITTLREVKAPFEIGLALLELCTVQLARGDAAGARASLAEVPSPELHRPSIDLTSARLALAAGQLEDAAARARSAMDAFGAAGRRGDRMAAAAVLARALLAARKSSEARSVLASIPTPDGTSFPVEATIRFRIACFLVLASDGHRAEASRGIARITADMRRAGLPLLENEARGAQADIDKVAAR